MAQVSFTVNGKPVSGECEDRTLLVDFLRDSLRLTGTHIGCDTSQCGCCTIHMNGEAVKACTLLAVQAEGATLTTIEGLATPAADGSLKLHPMQQAFSDCHGLQCGFCTPGMIMASLEIVRQHPNPTDAQIHHGLEGNLCRCTGYVNIVKAIHEGAARMRG
jgi:aerobic carbon-monoxide dehydrogenase small subunit